MLLVTYTTGVPIAGDGEGGFVRNYMLLMVQDSEGVYNPWSDSICYLLPLLVKDIPLQLLISNQLTVFLDAGLTGSGAEVGVVIPSFRFWCIYLH